MLITEITQLKLEGVAEMRTDKALCGARLTAPEEQRDGEEHCTPFISAAPEYEFHVFS